MSLSQRALQVVISTATVLVLLITAILLPFNPLFLRYEYQHPTFPADEYGFTTNERIQWGTISLQYIFNLAGPRFLANLTFPDGSPLFNEREVSHMLDVKRLVKWAVILWLVLIIFLVISHKKLERLDRSRDWLSAVSTGGWLLVGLVTAILVLVMVNFNTLFTAFHRIFFTGNSWLFLYSDTLIRLFPMRLWQDAFIFVGILAFVFGLSTALFARSRLKRSLRDPK